VWKNSSFQLKTATSLKRSKTGPRLLFTTNRKSHTRFRLVPKSTTFDDLERPFSILLTVSFGAHHKNSNEDRPTLLAAKFRLEALAFGNIRQC